MRVLVGYALQTKTINFYAMDTDREPAITYQVCKHEASHLLVAHLFQGKGAITLLQLTGYPELPKELRANCVFGSWFSVSTYVHASIPTLMAGIIADQLAGTPFQYCRSDLHGLAERSWSCTDAHIGFFAKTVHKILSSRKGVEAIEVVARQIEAACEAGDDRIDGAVLDRTFTKSLGRKFKFDKPGNNMIQLRVAPQVSHWELDHLIGRRIYSEILDAVPSIEIPGFR